MILFIKKLFFIFIILKFKSNKNFSYKDLNFRKIDYTNYNQVKSFIFKKNFYKNNSRNIHNFDFLNFSNKLGGKIGINLSKESICFCATPVSMAAFATAKETLDISLGSKGAGII